MNNIFTVEEINLIAIYAAPTKEETLDNIFMALPDITDEDIKRTAEKAIMMLDIMTEQEYEEYGFMEQFAGEEYNNG